MKSMDCEKTNLRERSILECPLCYEEVDQCDECCDEPTVNEDWYCYSDGDRHYCDSCWQEHLRKKKKPQTNGPKKPEKVFGTQKKGGK